MQKIISYFVIVLATTLLFFVNACTDSPIDEEFGSISGFITDAQSGEPLRAVNITLTPSGLSAVSGSDGRYEFVDLKPNQYTIQASRTGYQTNTKVVNVPRGNSVSCDIPLSPNSEPSTSVSLAVSETSVDFGTDISSYSLSLNNTGNASVGFEIDYNCDWLSITPISGIISGGGSQSITLSVNRQLLDGDATTTIQIKNVNDESVITVTVSASGNNEDPIIVTSGLMAYYTFDDGTANDKSGNNVNAILYGNPQLPTTSDWGRYLVLNSTLQSQYLKIPYNLFYNKHSWSVSFWIKDFGSGCIFAAQNTDSCDFDFDDAPELWVYEWTYNKFWISYDDLGIEETEQADFFDFNCNNIQYASYCAYRHQY